MKLELRGYKIEVLKSGCQRIWIETNPNKTVFDINHRNFGETDTLQLTKNQLLDLVDAISILLE